MPGSRFLLSCCLPIFISIACGMPSYSAEDDLFTIQYAMLLDGANPIVGKSVCHYGQRCAVLRHEEPYIDVILTAFHNRFVSNALVVSCRPKDCSFESGQSYLTFGSEREFNLYAGASLGREMPLILKERKKIGKILFIF